MASRVPAAPQSAGRRLGRQASGGYESLDQYKPDPVQEDPQSTDYVYAVANKRKRPNTDSQTGRSIPPVLPKKENNDDNDSDASTIPALPSRMYSRIDDSDPAPRGGTMSRLANRIQSKIRDFKGDDASSETRCESTTHPIDPYVKSKRVSALNQATFNGFIKNKDAALVFFYNSTQLTGSKAELYSVNNIAKAATTTERYNSGFAAVDCAFEQKLCQVQEIDMFPLYKLYTRGIEVGTLRDFVGASHELLRKYVEFCPIPEALQRTVCNKK